MVTRLPTQLFVLIRLLRLDWKFTIWSLLAISIPAYNAASFFRFIRKRLKEESKGQSLVAWDVGYFQGHWTHMARLSTREISKIFAFDPNSNSRQPFCQQDTLFNFGLLDSNSIQGFFKTGGTGDSIFRESGAHYEQVEAEMTQFYRADYVIEQLGASPPQILKLDVQGSELAVLRGFGKYIHDVRWIQVELPIVTYNLGAPPFQDVVGYLNSQGFNPVALCELHFSDGVLVQMDLVFEKG